MRKAERQMERMEKQSKKQYKKAKEAHYKHQAPKTKRMIQKDKRHAERMRRRQRSNPFFSSWGTILILIRCSRHQEDKKKMKKYLKNVIFING